MFTFTQVSSIPIITYRNYDKTNRLVITQLFIPLFLFNKYFRNFRGLRSKEDLH